MRSRLDLHAKLVTFLPNVYFQPPANITMKYPCIVYNKTGQDKKFSNNGIYVVLQEYQLMVIESNPDSTVANDIEAGLEYCGIRQYYTADNLNHTTLNLYY